MLVTPCLLLVCAPLNTSSTIAPDASSVAGLEAPAVDVLTVPEASTSLFAGIAFDPQGSTGRAMPPPPRPRERFTVKGGYFDSDENELEDGGSLIVSWIRPISKALSSEVEIGYLDASGTHNGVDRDVWAISFLANARAAVPLGERFEVYGGLGLGTFYYDAEASFGPVHASGDGFLFGGDGYFGGSIRLGESLSVGLEGKYYVTDDVSELGGGLGGFLAMLTVGFDL